MLIDLIRRRSFFTIASVMLILVANATSAHNFRSPGHIVVANRGSSSLSVIDTHSDRVVKTISMPGSGEPMYLAYSPQRNRLFVVDRANSRIVIFNAGTFEPEAAVPVGEGAFHCWIDPIERQAWITNDIDNTATVVDTVTLEVLATIPMPDDLVAAGYRNHDVNIALLGRKAYITMVSPGQPGWLLQYSTRNFELLEEREVGGDPHVSLRVRQPRLVYVMSQDAGLVYVLNRHNLDDVVPPISVSGAHGGVMNRRYASRYFYTTNLPDGGTNGLVTIDTRNFEVVTVTDTPYPVPHNMSVLPNGKKLYLTHSGAAANRVTVYKLNRRSGEPTFSSEIEVGLNPFGLTHVP